MPTQRMATSYLNANEAEVETRLAAAPQSGEGDGASPVSQPQRNEGTTSNRSEYTFRNGTFGQGLGPSETYAAVKRHVRMGF
jgi:hypothetical protein